MNNQTPDTLDTGGREERRKRVLALMDRLDLNAVLLRTYANFAWYTGGGGQSRRSLLACWRGGCRGHRGR